jgi:hypothetical protein
MNRKQFIRMSGAALGTLITSRWSGSSPSGSMHEQLAMPSKVEVVLDDGTYTLSGYGDYVYKDITVKIIDRSGGLHIFVHSPTAALQFVRLEWAFPLQNTVGVLGDHWERT